eukprot:9216896-Alexandrium_andersonii.AAC.1
MELPGLLRKLHRTRLKHDNLPFLVPGLSLGPVPTLGRWSLLDVDAPPAPVLPPVSVRNLGSLEQALLET